MKERLSVYMIELALLSSGAPFEDRAKEIYRMVEADREVIRAETREEFVDVSTLRGVSGDMVRYALGGLNVMPGTTLYIRHPPQKRAMTREEMVSALRGYVAGSILGADNDSVREMCKWANITTEVDE